MTKYLDFIHYRICPRLIDLLLPGAGCISQGKIKIGITLMILWALHIIILGLSCVLLFLHPLKVCLLLLIIYLTFEMLILVEPFNNPKPLQVRNAFLSIVAWFLSMFIVVYFGFGNIFRPMEIRDYSEFPGLFPGEVVLMQRLFNGIEKGDLVVAEFEGRFILGRVIGMGGDLIEISATTVKVNNQIVPSHDLGEVRISALSDIILEERRGLRVYKEQIGDKYFLSFYRKGIVSNQIRYEVEPDEVFLLCDNRSTIRGIDSRDLGGIPLEMVKWKVLFVLWSVEPGGRIRTERIGARWE